MLNAEIDWRAVFTTCEREEPASPSELERLAAALRRELSPGEASESLELPRSYRSFLSWSNGGAVRTGALEFCFYGTDRILPSIVGYHFAEFMPHAIPLGLDGSGNFAAFDVRSPLTDDEYPVVAVAAGNLGFDESAPLATSFEAFCRSRERVEDVLHRRPTAIDPEQAARLHARAAERQRLHDLREAEAAFKAGAHGEVVRLLRPHRGSLVGSLEMKLRLAEKRTK